MTRNGDTENRHSLEGEWTSSDHVIQQSGPMPWHHPCSRCTETSLSVRAMSKRMHPIAILTPQSQIHPKKFPPGVRVGEVLKEKNPASNNMQIQKAFTLQEKPACGSRSSTQNGNSNLGQRHTGLLKGVLGNSKYHCSNWLVRQQLHGAHVDWTGLVKFNPSRAFLVMYGQ